MTLQIDPITDTCAPRDCACAHCGQNVPAGLIEPGAARQFCCGGCRAVWQTVNACGLDAYYRLREAGSVTTTPASPGGRSYDAFDSDAFAAVHVRGDAEHRTADLFLEGVSCAACLWLVERLPRVLPGVIEARLSLKRATVRVTWDPSAVRLSQVARALDSLGYIPHPARGLDREGAYRREFRDRLVRMGVAGALMGNLMLIGAALYAGWAGDMDAPLASMLRWLMAGLGALSLAWPGREFFVSSWVALRRRAVNLDVPITVALLAGGLAGLVNIALGRGELYFDSLGALVFLLLVGRFIMFTQQRRAESAVELLLTLTPATCRLVQGEATREVPVEALRPGDVVEVRSGELMPADGVIVRGRTTVAQALLTGESSPVEVAEGGEVLASSQNGPCMVHVRVSAVGEESRAGRLMALLERGLSEKPDIVRFADRVGVAFVWAVSLVAVATLAWWWRISPTAAIDHTVALLIVTCPCVLGLATPMTLAMAIGRLARRDVLVKSGAALERLARGGPLLLDKTGTLTEGRLRVVEFVGQSDLRGVMARIERESSHPVARAITDAFDGCEPPADLRGPLSATTQRQDGGITATLGDRTIRLGSAAFMRRCGVELAFEEERRAHEAAGASVVLAAVDSRVCAMAVLRDQLRDDSAVAVSRLRAMGFRPEIWSGDAEAAVAEVARQVGVERARAGVSPEEKLEASRGAGGAGVMIGDGVNDAAALASAGVGIAVQGGAEASMAAADVYIAAPGLTPVVELVQVARRTLRVIHANFAVSLGYNLLAGVLAVTGHMNPLVAAILMPASSATVLLVAAAAMGRVRHSNRGVA